MQHTEACDDCIVTFLCDREPRDAVVVDVGRLYPDAPTLGVLSVMDVIVLVAASEPGPVATTMEWASRGGRHAAADVQQQVSVRAYGFDVGQVRAVVPVQRVPVCPLQVEGPEHLA